MILWIKLLCLLLVFSTDSFSIKAKKDSENLVHHLQEPLLLEAKLVRTNSIGVALMEQLKFEEAEKQFQLLLTLNPNFLIGHVNLGIAKYYSQKYDGASKSFQQALIIEPNQLQALYMTGLLHRNQANVTGAIESFRKVFNIDSEDPSTNYFLGLLYRRQKDFDQAIFHLEKAIETQPFNASARYNLAIALQRSGLDKEGKNEMRKFQQLQGQFGTDTIGLQYLEQGQYSLAIDNLESYLTAHPKDRETAPIVFKEISSTVGLHDASLHNTTCQESGTLSMEISRTMIECLGSGVSFGDFDNDGWYDLFVANSSFSATGNRLFRNTSGYFVDVTRKTGLHGITATMSGIWGDYNNDGSLDLYLVRMGPNLLYINNGDGTFSDATDGSGVADPGGGSTATAVDFDHDGDLDIYVSNLLELEGNEKMLTSSQGKGFSNVLYRNNGNGTFTDVAKVAGVDGGTSFSQSVFAFDINNSRDVDLLTLNSKTTPFIFSNQRDGTFRSLDHSFKTPILSMATGDLNRDGKMDLVAGLGGSNPKTILFWNTPGTSLRLDSTSTTLLPGLQAIALQTLDADNDGDLDIFILAREKDRDSTRTSLNLFENRSGTWAKTSEYLENYSPLEVRGLSVTDFDNDGDLDLALSINQRLPLLFRNDTKNQNNWVQIQLSGTNSNKSGIGTKVELLSGRLWQKAETLGGHGSMSQNPPLIHFGLGTNRPDVVRLLWPGGVLQSEIDPSLNQRFQIQELDRKGTSCPILYVWDGSNYRFQTDFLGGSAFGSLIAPGIYNYPDTDEYIKLSREDIALKQGKLAITLNNQLEEVIFFDQLGVLVVDHPESFSIYPEEKLLPGPPYDPFRVQTFQNPHLPLSAKNGKGHNVLEEIRDIDRVYPDLFEPLPFKGYAKLHELVLDLGDTNDQRVLLLMHGWIDYTDSTSNLAAYQAGIHPITPYLQVQDETGSWVTTIEKMGFPAGLPKPMIVDLTGKFLSTSRKIKIITNLRIYWDQILVESSPYRKDFRVNHLVPSQANLHFGGFPELSNSDGLDPKTYQYSKKSKVSQWKTHMGSYTRYGDVQTLLLKLDDMFVITRSGDEIEALFEVDHLPPLPEGWIRDYLVFVDGFGKDMDINSASPDHVGPLPFHGMTSFPYTDREKYPETSIHQKYLKTWNTRIVKEWIPPIRPNR